MIFSRLLGLKNSLLLLYDPVTEDSVNQMESEILEVRKYYRFVTLSEVGKQVREKNVKGFASVLLKNARKSTFLRVIPLLRGENIPFTLFLRSDCIGMNRLPPEEEQFRKEKGSTALNEMNPEQFFTTWGKIKELPERESELGLHFFAGFGPIDLKYIQEQTGRVLKSAYCENTKTLHEVKELGIETVVTERVGAISKGANPFDLPHWEMEVEEN